MSDDEKPKSPETTAESAESAESEAPAEAAAEGEGEPKADAAPAAEEDLASPEAVARRVAALGEEDESERQARIEEEKLAARRAKQKGGAGKRGLEAAASKKLAKIGDKKPAPVQARPAAPNDPLLQRTNDFAKWARQNRGLVGAIVAGAVLVIGGITLKEWLSQRKESQASEILAEGVAVQRGRLGDDTVESPDGFKDPTPMFKTAAARQDAALAKYRDVQTKFAGTGAAYLARLAEGSLLLDKRQVDDAIKAFSEVKSSPLAAADAEVRGRALEGLGFAYELKAQAGDASKLDDALKVFRELENTDVKGFKELGMYHQARVFESKGDKDKAKELLKSVHERANKPGEGHPFPYLESVADDRLRALDPTALPAKPSMNVGSPTSKMSDAQMRKMIEQLQKQMKEAGDKHGGGK